MFVIFYSGVSLAIFCRFHQKRRLCRTDNCSFYISTAGVFVLAMVGISYIEKANEYHTEDFKFTCAQLSLDEDVPDDSFLKEVNHIYHNASNLLCSASCPCGLRDGLDGRMLSEFDNHGDDELDHLRQLRVFKEAEGATSVDKCGHYL